MTGFAKLGGGLIVAAVLASGTAAAEEALTGLQLAERMDAVDHSKDSERLATMVIERGKQRLTRRMRLTGMKIGVDERSLIAFDEPADVRGTKYLSWVYDDPTAEDDLWVFFPSENLIRRISGGGKKGSFMRSDFANEDIEARAVADDTHELTGTATLNGRECYLLESTPIALKAKDSNYARRVSWVDKETLIALKIEYYDRRDRLIKTLSQGGIEQIDGIWTATKLIMETPRRGSRTLMQYSEVRYDQGLVAGVFDQDALKR
ncbi:MAG: outer membrane lipoprotein-sorting protein [Pseudomonadota bacterium]